MHGVLPDKLIGQLITDGRVQAGDTPIDPAQIQPASLDLRLGTVAYRLRASFLPGAGRSVEDCLDGSVVMHKIDLTDGAVLETGCVYLVPLQESLDLPATLSARANPKSSTGRLDVFTRVITDQASAFETITPGYKGPLYVEIAPRTFSVLAKPGERLVQVRFREGKPEHLRSETVSIDLQGLGENGIVGWRARRHCGLVDLSGINAHQASAYWEPLYAPHETLILDPEEFYILASKEAVQIPVDEAAEMAPIAPEIGEFRAHYAGFFDPGFGLKAQGGAGSRAVLEVRGRDVPFMLRHGQAVAKLDFEPMLAIPDALYGAAGSHYQAQSLRLSKHFK
ncbi:MAG TPA: 2'-deoxycytidine 5'-triphosphate deaminase [Hellea balneolensis]|uniref:2'-deoxycytidine 5'-triphosphate deaminase n=1 Tax=Hellea balneolensis TaxID=287478 RepID=A0A7C5LZL0_9PROT|nr:2'-deoxycytidine 5'-triphosphate deaminase [Hellea balneolensis]